MQVLASQTLNLLDDDGDTDVSFDRLVDSSTNALIIAGSTTTITDYTSVTANDEETITITSGDAAAEDLNIDTLNASDVTSLTLSGTADVIIANAIVGSTALATVDASGVTGAATVNASASNVAVTATGSTGVFTFTGGSAADTITGGAAGDTLNGGLGGDTISGGAGADTIDGDGGNDTSLVVLVLTSSYLVKVLIPLQTLLLALITMISTWICRVSTHCLVRYGQKLAQVVKLSLIRIQLLMRQSQVHSTSLVLPITPTFLY